MICKILNYMFGFTSRFSESTRSKVRTGLYFVLFFVAMMYAASIFNGVHLLYKCIVGAALMGLIILFSISGPIQRVKMNWPIVLIWFGMGLLQVVSGILTSLEYLPMAMIWLVAFPLLFLVWNNRRDYVVLFKEVAVAGNICFLILSLLSVTLYPMDAVQYGGFVNNPNGIGQWITFSLPLILFLYHYENSHLKKWLYRAEVALVLLLCFASKGRTAILAIALMILVFLALQWASNKNNLIHFLKQGGKFLLSAVLAWAVCLTINLIPQAIESARPDIPIVDQMPDGELDPDDSMMDQDKLPNPPAAQKTGVGTMIINLANRILGLDKTGASIDDYSSGRIGIWFESLEVMNFLGHPSREHIVTDRNGDVGNNVHNTILQWCYNNGIIAGVLFTVLMLLSGITLFKRSISRKRIGDIHHYMLIIHAGFACTSIFASLNLPFLYLIEFLYYLSFAVLFDKQKEQ